MPESLGPLLWGMQGSQCVGLRRVGGLAARGMIHGLPGELLGQQLTVQAKSPGEALLAAVSFSNAICVCVCVHACVCVCVCVCVWVCVCMVGWGMIAQSPHVLLHKVGRKEGWARPESACQVRPVLASGMKTFH